MRNSFSEEGNKEKEVIMCKDKIHINLLVTIDRNYVGPMSVMLQSYIEANCDIDTDLYVAHTALRIDDFEYIQEITKKSNVRVHNIRITEQWFAGIPVLERLPAESFYRLLAFHFLPKEVDRCLYLDPDIFIRKSLQSLYEMPLEDSYIAAASHLRGYRNGINKMRLALKKQERYINSGIMVMNLKKIRMDFTLDRVLSSLEENEQKLLLGDQDMVNILFGKKSVLFPEEIYNLDERTFRYVKQHKGWTLDTVADRTAIIHYNGKCKPWLNGYEGDLDVFYPDIREKGPAPTDVAKKHIKSFLHITKLTPQQTIIVGGAVLFIMGCLCSYFLFGKELLKIITEPESFRLWLDQFGAFDELVFILIRAAQTVIKFIPAEPLEIASGYAWGTVPGMLYCVVGNMIGTLVIFTLTRKYGKKILNLFVPNKKMKLIYVLEGSKKIYVLLFFLYAIPGSPKDGFTYFVGLLPVKLLPFMLISFVARMPSVLSSTLCGSSLAEQKYQVAILTFIVTIILAALGGIIYSTFVKRKEQIREGADLKVV